MKIVDSDNFNGDYPNETFVAEGIRNKFFADVMCKALNGLTGENSPRYYVVVEDDYVLRPGFEP